MMEKAQAYELTERKPRISQRFWSDEIKQAQKMLRKWHKQGTKIVRRYLDERNEGAVEDKIFRLNLFHSNIKTISDMLYSSLPKVEASRTNADATDDIGRVAAEVAERIINLDIAHNGQEYDSVLRSCLQDRLLPGLGCARVRYEAQFREEEVAAVIGVDGEVAVEGYTEQVLEYEDAPIDYYHWQDVLWGWGRSFSELPWIAFRSYLSKDEIEERFGEDHAKRMEYRKQKLADTEDSEWGDPDDDAPWMKAEVWEIWDKQTRKVIWFSSGCDLLLDVKDDTLTLEQFFPCPPFLIANATTALYRPTPDFVLAQDLYNSIDELQTRIAKITEAVKVVGVYDSSAEGVQRMLKEGVENDLIPVDDWALFAESGGLKGKIDWLPLQDVAATLGNLQQLRDEQIRLLQQITGMSDVMQGQLNSPYEGVGQSQIKAQFGSVRVQALQDQFAQFASDLLQLKLEVISKHFDPETIAHHSTMQYSEDAAFLQPAIELLKQPLEANIRIKVRPETVAMVDYARLKVERTEFLTAMATFLQSASPMLEREPDSMPYLLKMLQWTMAGFKGSQEIEGVLDQAIAASMQKIQQQQGQPQQPDPEQIKQQGEMEKIQAKAQADQQMRQIDQQADIATVMATHQAKMAEIQTTHMARIEEIKAKLQADLFKEQVTVQGDIQQSVVSAQAEDEKNEAQHERDLMKAYAEWELEMESQGEKTANKMAEILVGSRAKMQEMMAQQEEEPDDDEN
jgi:hypothetical protein